MFLRLISLIIFYPVKIIFNSALITITMTMTIVIVIIIIRLRSSTKYDIALMNQTMFLKFILFNQNIFRMNHHPSSVVQ